MQILSYLSFFLILFKVIGIIEIEITESKDYHQDIPIIPNFQEDILLWLDIPRDELSSKTGR